MKDLNSIEELGFNESEAENSEISRLVSDLESYQSNLKELRQNIIPPANVPNPQPVTLEQGREFYDRLITSSIRTDRDAQRLYDQAARVIEGLRSNQ